MEKQSQKITGVFSHESLDPGYQKMPSYVKHFNAENDPKLDEDKDNEFIEEEKKVVISQIDELQDEDINNYLQQWKPINMTPIKPGEELILEVVQNNGVIPMMQGYGFDPQFDQQT